MRVYPYSDRVQVSAPSAEPLSLSETKLHLHVDTDGDDPVISAMIAAGRDVIESRTGRQLIYADWEVYGNGFAPEMVIPMPPLQYVADVPSLVVNYIDTSGVWQVLPADQYIVSRGKEPVRIWPAFGVEWPATQHQPQSVKLAYTAGYGSSGASVPSALKQSMLLMIGAWYENREDVVIGTILENLSSVESAIALMRQYETGFIW